MTRQVRWGRWAAMAVTLAALAAGLTACWPFNESPTAVISANPLSGTSPLTVQFDASQSKDPDGKIKMTSWDFGDDTTSETGTVTHIFYAPLERTVYTVTLTVADDQFATDRATQSIEVLPSGQGGGDGTGGPIARIVTDRIAGRTPLTVLFDARSSTGGSGSIVQYQWHFGDGKEGTGAQVFHEYKPAATAEFLVTLYVWNDKGQMDADQVTIFVIVPTDEAGDENPTPELNMSDPLLLYVQDNNPSTPVTVPTRYEVEFDPRGTYADAGHILEYFVWDFGDGHTEVKTTDDSIKHIYELTAPSWTHIVRLTVYDDHGLEGTVTANVTLTQP